MKIKWVLIVATSLFVSMLPAKAGLFGNIVNGLNNADNGTKEASENNQEATNQAAALTQSPDAGKPSDGKPYYIKSDSGERMPFPFERIVSDNMSGYYKVSGAWYFLRNGSYFDYLSQKTMVRWEMSVSDSSEFKAQNGGVTIIAFDPNAMTETNDFNQLFLELKSAQESWWKSSAENKGENMVLTIPYGNFLEACMMVHSVRSDWKTVQVKIYKTIESGDDIATVKKKLSEDSSVTLLADTNQTNFVEFTSSYLGDPCHGIVHFTKKSRRVSEVDLVSSESIEQQKFVAQSIQTELNKSDVDHFRDELKESQKSTGEKIAGQAGNLNAVVRAMDISEIGKKWNAAINEKYPDGYSEDRRIQYTVDAEHATISIADVVRTYSTKMVDASDDFEKKCAAVEAEAKKVNASKNDL